MDNIDNSQIEGNDEDENYEFKFNFISMPWGDRTERSKIGVIVLLVSIFVATMGGLIHSFQMYYRGFVSVVSYDNNIGNSNCQVVKLNQYPFAARIHSMDTEDLLCIGALLNDFSVLAHGECIKSGPMRLYLGNTNDRPRCKSGFSVNANLPIYHEGVSKNMALLTSHEQLSVCGKSIPIGLGIEWNKPADVIGRTFHGERSLSRQPVSLAGTDCSCTGGQQTLNKTSNGICMKKKLSRCPVSVGDLLVQNGQLLGFSLFGAYRITENQTYCFADLSFITKKLKELGVVR